MTKRNYWASLILALCFSALCFDAATAADGPLAILVHAWREAPTPAHRATITGYLALYAKDLPAAVDYYRRVYSNYVTGDASTRATAALAALREAMGAAYPEPSDAMKLRHADRLLEAREYLKAKSEYAAMGASDFGRVGV